MPQSKDLDMQALSPDDCNSPALIDAVSSHLPAGWFRDPEAEAHMDRLDLEQGSIQGTSSPATQGKAIIPLGY